MDKMVFKCRHCDNDNILHMRFYSLEYKSDRYKNSFNSVQYDRETEPKIPIGIHINCAKCGKDTLFIPEPYGYTKWDNDITEEMLTRIPFVEPEYSSISYIVNSEGLLDKIVKRKDGKIISTITNEEIDQTMSYSVINKEQYDILYLKGLDEVTISSDKKEEE